MVAIVGIIVTSVLLRKFFNTPLFFGEEVVGMLMSVSLFLALPMVTLQGTHVRVTILSAYLKKRSRVLFAVISSLAALVGIACCAWLVIDAIPWLDFAIKHNLKTETSRILLSPAMAVLPISISLTGVVFAARLFGWIGDNEENGSEKPADTGD
ncbi:MAG: TRAP transporter small permease [Rhodospirillales bacterium]|nr:TRAP transporter small permease [Rhodospirillales bacterium]